MTNARKEQSARREQREQRERLFTRQILIETEEKLKICKLYIPCVAAAAFAFL